MSIPKRHHYIPQALLRNFCFSSETLYYYSKKEPEKGVQERNIKSVFQKRHLNTVQHRDGSRSYALEEFYGREFDNYVPDFVSVLGSYFEQRRRAFNTEERNRFIQFFYNHMKRSPDFHQPIVDRTSSSSWFEEAIQELEKKHRPLTEAEWKLFSDEATRKRIIDRSRVESLSEQREYTLNLLSSKNIVVAIPQKQNKQFIVASNPVVRFSDHPKANLVNGPIELWTTLSPRLAVGLCGRRPESDALSLTDDFVRKINYGLVRNSRCFASANEILIRSLANSR